MQHVNTGDAVNVQIFCTEGCGNTAPTVDLVKKVAQDLDISVNIETVTVDTREQAQELRLLGSPTVQIDGLDIEPSARDSVSFGLS